LAPEIYKKAEGYDFGVDVWSLGCCLYEIVVGNPPFSDPSEKRLKQQVLTQDVKMKDYFSKKF